VQLRLVISNCKKAHEAISDKRSLGAERD